LFIPAAAMPRSIGSDDELVLLDRPPEGVAVLLDELAEPDGEVVALPDAPDGAGELATLPEPLDEVPPGVLGVAVDELVLPGEVTVEDSEVDEPVAGDALGLPVPTAACATRLQRSKSAWVGVAVCAWTVVTASSPAIETSAAVRLVLNMFFLLRDVFRNDAILVGRLRFKRGARDNGAPRASGATVSRHRQSVESSAERGDSTIVNVSCGAPTSWVFCWGAHHARVAKLADALDLGSSGCIALGGSTPPSRTKPGA
jgi:hypothetical protein